MNLYEMVTNNPVNYSDPDGLKQRLHGARVEFWNNSSFGVNVVFDTEGTPGGAGPDKRVGWKLKVPAGYRTTKKIDTDYVQLPNGDWMHFFNPVGAIVDKLPIGVRYKHPGKTCEAVNVGGGLFHPLTGYDLRGPGFSRGGNNNPKTGFPTGYEGGPPNGSSPLWIMPVQKALSLGYIVKIPQRPKGFKVTFK